jgi:hypothetical protein
MLPADCPADRPSHSNHRFSVLAAAEASVMSRILELFAKRGLVPERVDARRSGLALAIDLEVADLPQDTAEHILRCLSTMVTVERALMISPCEAGDPALAEATLPEATLLVAALPTTTLLESSRA